MQIFQRATLAVVAVLATIMPASAQAIAANAPANGTLVTVWGWILVAGIIIFIGATSAMVRPGK